MRFLFVVFPEPGHFNPMVGVLQHLASEGHELAVFSMEDLSHRLDAAGLDVRCHFAGEAAGTRTSARGREFASKLARPAFAQRWYQYVLVTQVPTQIAALREVARTFQPDVIATDPLAYAGPIVAEQQGIAWAAIAPLLVAISPTSFRYPYVDYLDALADARARLLATEGVSLRFKSSEAISPWLNTVFATEALVPREQAENAHSIYVGPSWPRGRRGDEPEFPWHRLTGDRPLVYAAFGTQLAPPVSVFEAIGDALLPSEAEIVLAYGEPGDLPALPAHVLAVKWAPQRTLLARAACMISHGGANSFSECMTSGKPILVVPLGHEQPLQAMLATRAGVGLALDPAAASAERIGTCLRALLGEGEPRRRAAEIGRSYSASDGARRAADLLVELANRRSPILP